MKKITFTVFLIAALLIIQYPAMAQSQATIDVFPFGVTAYPEVGQKIQITVHIQNTGSVTLNGFVVKYRFQKPDGTYTATSSVTYYDVLQPGGDVYKTINTNVVADKAGWWSVDVYLYTRSGTYLSYDSGDFQVVQPSPQATITITNVAGYAILGASIAFFVYALTRRG